MRSPTLLFLALTLQSVQAAPASSPTLATAIADLPQATGAAPIVKLDYGTFRGKAPSGNGINTFLGIPFASPPVGPLRFRRPTLPGVLEGIQDASQYGQACSQQQNTNGQLNGVPSTYINAIEAATMTSSAAAGGEDCLTINVIAPSYIPPGGLPIVLWIYGGGFAFGTTKSYEGTPIVQRSMATDSPVIFVSANYRLRVHLQISNGFGFMASKEMQAEGAVNLGLYDQRAAMEWTKKYIHQFGGDSNRTVIWGESAGAISVALHLLKDGGDQKGLFQGGFMNSGSQFPITNSIASAQPYYDALVKEVDCSSSSDTLECLRGVDYDTIKSAMDFVGPSILSYSSLNVSWIPRTDGEGGFLPQNGQELMRQGLYSKVPLICGDLDDEGTLFSLSQYNTTSEDEAVEYIRSNYFPHATPAEIAGLRTHYDPADIAAGSPFDTGMRNVLYPAYKFIAAVQGDMIYQGPRRFLLNLASKTQDTWAFLDKRNKQLPFVGSVHSSDVVTEFFAPGIGGVDNQFIDYLVNFVNYLDPNSPNNGNAGIIPWPKWNSTFGKPEILELVDQPEGGPLGLQIGLDTFREAAIAFLNMLTFKYPN